jgi:molecular chaperone GrpE (heat shock protein)
MDAVLSGESPAPDPGPHDAAGQIVHEVAALRASVESLATIPSRLDALVVSIEKEHQRAAFRESVIDRLHTENQQLRRGELEALLEPVRGGLFRVHDMARRAAAQCRATEPAGAQLLDAVADEAADVLLSVGVERFDAVPGELFDPARHRQVGVAAADDKLPHGTVTTSRAAGFTAGVKVVRKASVVVARHPADAQPPAVEPGGEG